MLTHVPPVKWLKVPEPEFDFLDFDEAARLEKGGTGEWAVMITIGLTTGLRQGERLALRWEDVDLVRGRLLVRRAVARGVVGTPKSGKSREIPLNEKALAALRRLAICETRSSGGFRSARHPRPKTNQSSTSS